MELCDIIKTTNLNSPNVMFLTDMVREDDLTTCF